MRATRPTSNYPQTRIFDPGPGYCSLTGKVFHNSQPADDCPWHDHLLKEVPGDINICLGWEDNAVLYRDGSRWP